jgi:hypothetical protein
LHSCEHNSECTIIVATVVLHCVVETTDEPNSATVTVAYILLIVLVLRKNIPLRQLEIYEPRSLSVRQFADRIGTYVREPAVEDCDGQSSTRGVAAALLCPPQL